MGVLENRKKYFILRRLLSILLICSICLPANIIVKAAETAISESAVEIDYIHKSVKVDIGDNDILYFELSAKQQSPKTWDHITTKRAKDGKVTIDLSSLSTKKDNYLYLKGSKDKKETCITLKKENVFKLQFAGNASSLGKELKAAYEAYPKFSNETGYYIFYVDENEYTKLENVKWCKGDGNWKDFKELDLSLFSIKGATLQFRLMTGEEFPSKPIKSKYTAKAKAPSITVNGDNHTIKLTSVQEYRVSVSGAAFTAWTTPTFSANKKSDSLSINSLVGIDQNGNGNGINTPFKKMVIEVRMAGNAKKVPSKAERVILEEVEQPKCNKNGITVESVDESKPSAGLNFTNASDLVYEVSVIEGASSSALAIQNLNLLAKKNTETGYVKWTKIKAGNKLKYAYNSYKDFTNPVAICRVASVKEDKKTVAIEFRLASVIRVVKGSLPKFNVQSSVITIPAEEESVQKQISIQTEDSNCVIYYTEDGSDPKVTLQGELGTTKEYKNPFSVTVKKGETKIVKAIGVLFDSNKEILDMSEVVLITLIGKEEGAEGDYTTRWGYLLCQEEDAVNGNQSLSKAYQACYEVIKNQEESADLSSKNIKVSTKAILKITERIRYDNPEFFYFGGGIGYTANAEGQIVKVSFQYNQEKEKTAAMAQEIEETYLKIVALSKVYAGNDNPSDIQKVKAIHDYLVLNNEYKSSTQDQNIYGAMSEKSSPVCMSYAMSFLYCCQRMGVQCHLVVGMAGKEAHAWNLLRLESGGEKESDNWYLMDVTWDDPVGAGKPLDYIGIDWFNITTDKMNSKTPRSIATDVYSKLPIEKATGTKYAAENVYNASNLSGPSKINGAIPYVIVDTSNAAKNCEERCGFVEPEVTAIK